MRVATVLVRLHAHSVDIRQHISVTWTRTALHTNVSHLPRQVSKHRTDEMPREYNSEIATLGSNPSEPSNQSIPPT
jgi:hypothetical protein